ncbi:glutamine-hydrolyzing GMP synthase [Ruminococcus sp.]|uniref:glutamine-hydrolyzing GMP synthase n=1 Tax=Ruminococcus sp. TaxID=41978 RepID=UPI0025E86CC7|nr:glutamine-hydrolyzing GMP synthase [Ruminococcus sp.]MBQ6252306.1 glutamine-hydrolyzing GMP synthase [Ruminococcus sp.]
MSNQLCIVLDFGGQYNQLIARRVRECGVYCEIKRFDTPISEIKAMNPTAIIFTGGPNSVYDPSSPHISEEIFSIGVPILGICYGCQLMAYTLGGKVESCEKSEYGKIEISQNSGSLIFEGVPEKSVVWMSHTDFVSQLPEGFSVTAKSADCPCAAFEAPDRKLYAVQFHPEVTHSEYGKQILHNFLYNVCGCTGDWVMDDFIENTVAKLREQIGDKKVILGLSGGVDSSVAAGLLSRAVGKQLTCVFVDQGLMRKDEGDFVEETFTKLFDMNFVRVNCKDQFLKALKGVSDPEQKRKIIGTEFYNVFWDKIREQGTDGFFAQGTIYPDRIESGRGNQAGHGSTAVIKTHHNMVKMPEDIKFAGTIEPLGDLFKDEVRQVGEKLGIPHDLVWRQPFPGPGLGVRIIGEITEEKIKILQEADAVFRDEIRRSGIESELKQFFAVLPDVRTVGVMGDHRTYDHLIAIRAVTTDDFMTADWARIPYDVLARVSNRLCNEVEHVNRVVYDITSKPPGTVEWE